MPEPEEPAPTSSAPESTPDPRSTAAWPGAEIEFAATSEEAGAATASRPAPGPVDLVHAMDPERMESLDRKVVVYWLLGGIVSFVILSGLGALGWFLFSKHLPGPPIAWLVALAILLGSMLLWNVAAPVLAYRRWRFEVGNDLMLARYGIVFHEEKAIPISRLQHVELGRGPLERLFGLATLVVFTAGSENAAFRLPGLRVERAQELRDQILEARGDDVL
jgi:membrane protein YdbS with pleckstrin-like domain